MDLGGQCKPYGRLNVRIGDDEDLEQDPVSAAPAQSSPTRLTEKLRRKTLAKVDQSPGQSPQN